MRGSREVDADGDVALLGLDVAVCEKPQPPHYAVSFTCHHVDVLHVSDIFVITT